MVFLTQTMKRREERKKKSVGLVSALKGIKQFSTQSGSVVQICHCSQLKKNNICVLEGSYFPVMLDICFAQQGEK